MLILMPYHWATFNELKALRVMLGEVLLSPLLGCYAPQATNEDDQLGHLRAVQSGRRDGFAVSAHHHRDFALIRATSARRRSFARFDFGLGSTTALPSSPVIEYNTQ
jgi:hypothetical protein